MKDRIFENKQVTISNFTFDDAVVSVFPDMIKRSIPGYETMISMTGMLVATKIKSAARVYDLGCSLGASASAILDQNHSNNLEIIAVDNSKDMIEKAKDQVTDPRVKFVLDDVLNINIESADAVVCNFIMQFLPPERRLSFLEKILTGMNPGAILLLSEKVDEPFYISPHEAWKKANGYSDLEVEQKRQSLERVMLVDSESAHLDRFESVGFKSIHQWYRCLNWASFMMYK